MQRPPQGICYQTVKATGGLALLLFDTLAKNPNIIYLTCKCIFRKTATEQLTTITSLSAIISIAAIISLLVLFAEVRIYAFSYLF